MTLKWTTPLLGLCLGAAMLATAPARAQAQKPVELTFSAWIPHTHVLVANFMIPWGKEVEQATEGRVKVNFLPKPVTNPVGHLDAVRNGLVDLAFISHSYYPGRFDLMKFAILPFSGQSAESTSVASWRIYDKYLREAGEHRGVKLLGLYGHGPGAVFTTDKKVQKVEDFDGLKLRIGGGIQADLARALGFNAVVKPAPESYELMSTGVVDGVLFPPESVASFRLDGVVKNATLFPGGLYADLHGIVMNERAFQRLSPKDQAILLKLSGEHIARMGGKAWGDADVAALQSLKSKNVAFHQASDALVSGVRARTAEFEKSWLEAAKAKGIDGPKLLADYRAELRKLEGTKQ
ncbi:TRAP transporter substrate-binding protein [Ramlibacter sp. AN1015]|uniref:TRAP transporter substrate-binding protein n=1 Tax=Ramlibacter sp. AN1015 TaxID=3133428 RepID=UPI0030C4782A